MFLIINILQPGNTKGGSVTVPLTSLTGLKISGWRPTHLTSVFSLRTSVTSPNGTTLTAFADVKYRSLWMLDRLVYTHLFGISCMTTDNFCFYLQNRLIQISQTEGQWYKDTSPFSIPCYNHQMMALGMDKL